MWEWHNEKATVLHNKQVWYRVMMALYCIGVARLNDIPKNSLSSMLPDRVGYKKHITQYDYSKI